MKLEDKLIKGSDKLKELNENSNPVERRNFLKTLGFVTGLTGVIAACKKSNPYEPDPIIKSALLYIKDFYGNAITGGVVDTDKGRYPITNGVCTAEYNNSTECEINVNNHVKWRNRLENGREHILIPTEWERFFAHSNIAAGGTYKFNSNILTYIDGNISDPDYSLAKSRLAVSGSGRAGQNFVDSADEANFIVHLNSDRTSHAEPGASNGNITRCDVYLKNNVPWERIDEEIAQGLTHTGNALASAPSEGIDSCIGGALRGWQDIDSKIMNAFYNRRNSKFTGTGYETEL